MATGTNTKIRPLAACPTCGRTQPPEIGLWCRLCGTPLLAPGHIYRRTPSGGWERLAEFDPRSFLGPLPPRRRKLPIRRWALLVLLAFVPGGLLWGWSWTLQQEVAQQQAQAEAYREQSVGLIQAHMEATAERVAGGKLILRGRTNLPDGTILGARVRRGNTVLAHDYPIVVSGGLFHSTALANRGRAFGPGEYEMDLLARFAPTAQPPRVFDLVGPGGKKLTGPLVESAEESPRVKRVALRGAIRVE